MKNINSIQFFCKKGKFSKRLVRKRSSQTFIWGFLRFSKNLSETLVYRKINTTKKSWKFEDIYWIRVEKEHPFTFKYKASFDPSENFKEVSLLRKNIKGKTFGLNATQKYDGDNQNPIKLEKKRDLLQLLKYIKPENHQFFEDLKAED